MTTWSSNDDYTVSDEELTYYKKRVNGVGLVITGCTHVTPNGIGFTNEFAAYDDKFTPGLRKLAEVAELLLSFKFSMQVTKHYRI